MINLSKNLVKIIVGASSVLAFSSVNAQELDSDSATVTLEVGKYAEITLLDDFSLTTLGVDGDKGAVYSGKDEFKVESNCAVNVSVSGADLSKGEHSIPTDYKLDNADDFNTAGPHSQLHEISAEATLGEIDDQEAGGYSAEITITVSAI